MSEKITFSELVEKISAETKQNEQTTNDFIHELAGIIETSLGTGEKISISGFGKFELRWVDERKGHNPQTGEEITIPGQNKVVFKPYKALRERVNQPFENLESQVIDDEPKNHSSAAKAPVLTYSASTIPTPQPASSTQEHAEEDLIVERDRPVDQKPRSKSETSQQAKKEYKPSLATKSDDENLAWVFEQKMQHQDEMAKDVQSNGNYKWSYTAAAIIVLLAIFLLVFVLNNMDETPSSEIAQLPTQSTVAQIDHSTNSEAGTQYGSASEQSRNAEDEGQSDPPASSESNEVISDRDVATAHSITDGESLWSIAEKQYGDPYLWPLIYEANPGTLNNPNILSAGNSLQVPALNNPENLSQAERKMVALGYISVYDWILENQPDDARYYLWAAGSFSQEVLRDASENVNEADLAFATQG